MIQARAGFGPTVVATANRTETRYRDMLIEEQPLRPFAAKQASVQLTQPVLRGALYSSFEASQAQLEQAQAQLEQARAEAIQRFVEACFDVLKARDALGLSQAQRAATSEQLLSAQRAYKVGTSPVTDVREAEAKADAVAAQLAAAEFDLELKQQVLAEIAGQRVPALLGRGLGATQLPQLDASSVLDWLAGALNDNAQMMQARHALTAAEAEVRRAAQAHAPTADLTYTYTRNSETGSSTSPFPRSAESNAVGLNVNIPLFASGATQAKVREALALRDKAQSDVDAARRTVTLAVRQGFSATLSALSQAHGLEAASKSAEVSLRANRRGYEVGMKVNAEVLESQSRLFEARRDLSRARYDAWVNYVKLKAAAGRLTDADLSQIDGLLMPVQALAWVPTRQGQEGGR